VIENCRMVNAPKSWAAARPDHFDSPGLSSQVAVVYLRNDCVPWKSDFASLASEKNKIATCGGVLGTVEPPVMTIVAPPLKCPPD
jgi:hypothetical protein